MSFSPKLAAWRNFRKEIDTVPLAECLDKVSYFWSSAPFVPYYLDSLDPLGWPDPWTLIEENIYCDLAKSLAILYTIYFTQHFSNIKMELRIYKCVDSGHEYNLVWINDGEFILNHSNDVVNTTQLQQVFTLVKQFTTEDLQLDRY